MLEPLFDKPLIRAALSPSPTGAAEGHIHWLVGATPEFAARVHAAMPARRTPAAVLVPLVERDSGMTVLLTQRATTLKDHAGQISFPGGRIEPGDADPWHAALREANEEIGLSPQLVEFAGYLPDHVVISGFQVTPAVGFVSPHYELQIEPAEVHDVFEVPLAFILDAANHKSRLRTLGDLSMEVHDIPYDGRNIWGATAAMLMTFRQLLQSRTAQD